MNYLFIILVVLIVLFVIWLSLRAMLEGIKGIIWKYCKRVSFSSSRFLLLGDQVYGSQAVIDGIFNLLIGIMSLVSAIFFLYLFYYGVIIQMLEKN